MLYEKLRSDLTAARKARESSRVTLLSTVIGEMAANAILVDNAKVVDDTLAISVLKKTIKGLDELLGFKEDSSARHEKILLETYLPKQLSESDLRTLIEANRTPASNMGTVMAWLKTNYSGQYDGKLASTLVKEILSA